MPFLEIYHREKLFIQVCAQIGTHKDLHCTHLSNRKQEKEKQASIFTNKDKFK